MVRHLLFLRWWLLAAITIITTYFLKQFGVLEEIWKTDTTFISVSIAAVFVVMSIWCGIKTFTLSDAVHRSSDEEKLKIFSKIENQEQAGWFVSDAFMMAGFVGTVWGMIEALGGFKGIDPSDITSIQALISSLVKGVSVALYTTLTGLVCAMLLKFQYFNLSYARQDLEGKNE